MRQQELGQGVAQICREHSISISISEATFYTCKNKLDGVSTNELQRLKHLEDESRRLKQLYAKLSLENQYLIGLIALAIG